MTTGSLDTVIRMNVDSAQGVAATNKLDGAMTNLKSRGVNSLGSGFGSLATQALAATGAQEKMGASLSFLSGSFSMVGQSIGMLNPLLLGAVAAATLLATAFARKREEIKLAAEAVQVNADALVTLINRNNQVAVAAERFRQQRIAELETEKEILETKINNKNATQEQFDKEMSLSILRAQQFTPSQALITLQKYGNATEAERVNRLAEVIAELAKLNEEERKAKETKEALSAATKELNLNLANEEALGALLNEQMKTQAANAQKLLDIETQRSQLRSRGEGDDLAGIVAASNSVIEAERTAYESRLENANAFDGSRQVIEAQFTFFVEQEEARRNEAIQRFTKEQIDAAKKAEAERKKIKLTAAQEELRTVATNAARMLLIQKASLGETIATIIAEQQARLAALALVAFIEGIYYSFTNPATAASKFTAAAMAGAGAATLGAIGSAFQPRDSGVGEEESQSLAGTDGGSRSSGRTLVQQGPLTLNYHATMIVNGHVFDIDDVYQMWQNFNANQLRAAGVQSDELRT